MGPQSERESVMIRGYLGRGDCREWRATDSTMIYVGSDPRCQWQIEGHDVAPFQWRLCWFGGRLWMEELRQGPGAPPDPHRWTLVATGTPLKLGRTAIMFETQAELDPSRHAAAGDGTRVHRPN